MIGFYTTRLVRAVSEAEAREKASRMLMDEWTSGANAIHCIGKLPAISVESVEVAGFLDWVRFKKMGYAFYTADDPNAVA
jgi:hypothetical protein